MENRSCFATLLIFVEFQINNREKAYKFFYKKICGKMLIVYKKEGEIEEKYYSFINIFPHTFFVEKIRVNVYCLYTLFLHNFL